MTFDESTTEKYTKNGHSNSRVPQLLLVYHKKLLLDALRPELLKLSHDVRIIECNSYDEAIQSAATCGRLTLAILALRMPGMNGTEGVRAFRTQFPKIPLVVLSGHYTNQDVLDVFECGAAGFISMTITLDGMIHALRLILSGVRYFPSETLETAHSHRPVAARGKTDDAPLNPIARLTTREREVLEQLIEGHANKVIARNLRVQEVTVKLHVGKLLRKLGAANRTQAVKIALQLGWGING